MISFLGNTDPASGNGPELGLSCWGGERGRLSRPLQFSRVILTSKWSRQQVGSPAFTERLSSLSSGHQTL